MTYKINGTEITVQPSEGRWLPKEQLGYDGNGHPIYVGTRQFEMRWDLLDDDTVSQLQGFFNAVITTGSAVIDLPKFAVTPYAFYAYSGCVINNPDFGAYFVEHNQEVSLLISRIRA